MRSTRFSGCTTNFRTSGQHVSFRPYSIVNAAMQMHSMIQNASLCWGASKLDMVSRQNVTEEITISPRMNVDVKNASSDESGSSRKIHVRSRSSRIPSNHTSSTSSSCAPALN